MEGGGTSLFIINLSVLFDLFFHCMQNCLDFFLSLKKNRENENEAMSMRHGLQQELSGVNSGKSGLGCGPTGLSLLMQPGCAWIEVTSQVGTFQFWYFALFGLLFEETDMQTYSQ